MYRASIDIATPTNENLRIAVRTVDAQGAAAPNTWVGVFAAAPTSPAELVRETWSNQEGACLLSGLPAGSYRIIAAFERVGTFEISENGVVSTLPPDTLLPASVELLRPKSIVDFTLDPQARWSDGTPVTSADFAVTHKILQNPAVDADAARARFRDITACEPLSPNKVRFRFRRSHFQSLELASRFATCLQPKHFLLQAVRESVKDAASDVTTNTWGKAYNQCMLTAHPLSNGRYVIREWDRGNALVLERNSRYQLVGRETKNNRIQFRFIADSVTALQALRAREIDVCFGLSPEALDGDVLPADYEKLLWHNPAVSFVAWNCRRPPFDDHRLRIAMALLSDRESFARQKLSNTAIVVSGPQYVYGPSYDSFVKPIAFDPEAAREVLAEAGWIDSDADGILDKDGKRFEFTYIVPTSAGPPDLATLFQKQLKDVGVTMKIRQFEWASFGELLRHGDFDAAELGYVPHWETDLYPMWHSSAIAMSRAANATGFTHPEIDRLVERIPTILNVQERLKWQHELHRLIDNYQPCLFLFNRMSCAAASKRVHNIQLFPSAPGFDLSQWTVLQTR